MLGGAPGALSLLQGLSPTGGIDLFGGLTRALDCFGLTRALGLLTRPALLRGRLVRSLLRLGIRLPLSAAALARRCAAPVTPDLVRAGFESGEVMCDIYLSAAAG